jgi:hypothetical protein
MVDRVVTRLGCVASSLTAADIGGKAERIIATATLCRITTALRESAAEPPPGLRV